MKLEAQVELSQERSALKGIFDDAGFEARRKRALRSWSLPPEGGGIIRSKISRSLRIGKSRLIKA
jgi:hypothetical protein